MDKSVSNFPNPHETSKVGKGSLSNKLNNFQYDFMGNIWELSLWHTVFKMGNSFLCVDSVYESTYLNRGIT